jgi:hypothetical protein
VIWEYSSVLSAPARPKSSTFAVPSGQIMTLRGVRSRWMMPRSCAAARTAHTWAMMAAAHPTGTGSTRSIRFASVTPSTHSMTMNSSPSSMPKS